jgi:formylglycine-generating enzyme required for sulfatase activity
LANHKNQDMTIFNVSTRVANGAFRTVRPDLPNGNFVQVLNRTIGVLNVSIGALILTSALSLLALPVIAQAKARNGKTFRDCSDCPAMVMIPGGTFVMGSAENEVGRDPFEGPQRPVTIRQFAVGKFPITKSEWSRFAHATGRSTKGGCAWSGLPSEKPWRLNDSASWEHLGFDQTDNDPVVCINWNDAQEYVRWLSVKTGSQYRLLTESEWEYVARAGTITPYPWGLNASHEYANYGADSGYVGMASGRDQWMHTSPAGSFPPNKFGVYDMIGNVMQFVEDCFSDSYKDLPQDGSAYKTEATLKTTGRFAYMTGTTSCSYRIARGGNYGDPPSMLRSAFRNWAPARGTTLENYRSAALGFRIAKTL